MKKLLLIILPVIVLLSCSVQKRKYQKGFYVSTLKHKKQVQNNTISNSKSEIGNETLALKTVPLPSEPVENEIVSASADNTFLLIPTQSKQKSNPDSLCDKITLRNGDEYMVTILEITPNDVKYKKCDSPDGPLYVVKKADVFMINYANGTKEVFKEDTPQTNTNNNSTKTNPQYDGPKKTHPMAIVALIFLILGFITYGLGWILSIVFARIAERKIREQPKVYSGEPLARISRIISTVLLSIIAGIIVFALILALLFL